MEALDKAREREFNRLHPSVADPVRITNANDIKITVSEFDPSKNPQASIVNISTRLKDDEHTYAVSAQTKSKSKRDQIIEGLNVIKKRIENQEIARNAPQEVEINGRMVKPPMLGNGIDSHSWVDPLIRQWFGGNRDGLIIYWDLDDGFRYKYDIYQHKLTRSPKD